MYHSIINPTLKDFRQKILQLPDKAQYVKEDLLQSNFLIDKQDQFELYYAAHNEYINTSAKVMILGITPGWQQMERSIFTARQCLLKGLSLEETAYQVKLACRFYGVMRETIIVMLNKLQLHEHLGLGDSGQLFTKATAYLHSSSCIRYPVFFKGKNYTGHTPNITLHPLLLKHAEQTIMRDIVPLQQALIIPLGRAVEDVLRYFIKLGQVREEQCLFGFPHPSGANGHRYKQFEQNKESMMLQLNRYYNN